MLMPALLLALAPSGSAAAQTFLVIERDNLTIESVMPLSRTRLGVLTDNNYPFSTGREAAKPDPNEFIIITLERPIADTPSNRP
jgi:hypothetical protein